MIKVLKYCYLFLFVGVIFTSQGQYLCENEYKIINKQKKVIQNKTQKTAKDWIFKYQDSLNLPPNIKLSKLKFLASEKEIHKNNKYNKWYTIDSLFCVETDPKLIEKAKKKLVELNLVVYKTSATFSFDDTKKSPVKSLLYFEFNFKGELIRAVIRKKEMSSLTETYYH